MQTWDHVTATASKRVLQRGVVRGVLEVLGVLKEMSDAVNGDADNLEVSERMLQVRGKAVEALGALLAADNDVFDANGEFVGNAGYDQVAALDCIRYFWSDGVAGKLPEDPLAHVKEESPPIYELLTGVMAVTSDVLRFAVAFTWLRHEYSQRCDVDDFSDEDWNAMDAAINAADTTQDPLEVLNHLNTYWRLWRRYSTPY